MQPGGDHKQSRSSSSSSAPLLLFWVRVLYKYCYFFARHDCANKVLIKSLIEKIDTEFLRSEKFINACA
jgi:hypothetical protein